MEKVNTNERGEKMDNLIPWDKFSNQIYYFDGERWEDTNIACPECGSMIERRTDVVLTSNPPKHHYRCTKCDWRGTK